MPYQEPLETRLLGKGSERKRNDGLYVTDIATTENTKAFLKITRAKKSDEEAWSDAYKKLFPNLGA
jgi:hypothetical protein